MTTPTYATIFPSPDRYEHSSPHVQVCCSEHPHGYCGEGARTGLHRLNNGYDHAVYRLTVHGATQTALHVLSGTTFVRLERQGASGG